MSDPVIARTCLVAPGAECPAVSVSLAQSANDPFGTVRRRRCHALRVECGFSEIPGENGPTTDLALLLSAVDGNEAFVMAQPADMSLLDLVCRYITETQAWTVDPWPVVALGEAVSGDIVRRISRVTGGAAASVFEAAAEANRRALRVPEGSRQLVENLQRALEDIAAAIADTSFGRKYGVDRVLMVGSTSRGTYTGLPVDLDLAVLTRNSRTDIAASDARSVSDEIASRLASSPELDAYARALSTSEPSDTRFSIELADLAVRGPESLVARYDLVVDAAGRRTRSLLLDITYGRMPHTLGYEIWIRRYLGSLSADWAERLQDEIRLAKRVLKQIGSLYGSTQHGMRAHAVEQMVIQSFNYRASGLPIGTFDNAMLLLCEENGANSSGDLREAYEDFKWRFPLWHVGWWEKEVGLDSNAGRFNFWNFLGDGAPDVADQRWATLMRLARLYREYRESNSLWTIDELAHRVRSER